jgi:hypothetical protein
MRRWRRPLVAVSVLFVVLMAMSGTSWAWLSPLNTVVSYAPPGPPQGARTTNCSVQSANGSIYGVAYAKIRGTNSACGLLQTQVIYATNGTAATGPTAAGYPTGWIQSQQIGRNVIGANFYVFAKDVGYTIVWQTSIFG